MTVWLVIGESESGDRYIPKVCATEPTDATLRKFVADWDGTFDADAEGDGPGAYGSYVHLTVTAVEVLP